MGQIYTIPITDYSTWQNVKANGLLCASGTYASSSISGNVSGYYAGNGGTIYMAPVRITPSSTTYGVRCYLASSEQYSLKFAYVRSDNTLGYFSPAYTTSSDQLSIGFSCSSYGEFSPFGSDFTTPLDCYGNETEALNALRSIRNSITYRLTNCTAPDAPSSAASGSQVIVPLVFSEGFGIVNNTDLYVMNDGVLVTSLWNPNDNTLSFTMP